MSKITAFGTYVPEKIIDNQYFESLIETNDEWIVSRTGIKTRRFAAENENTSDQIIAAIDKMKSDQNIDLNSIDYIIVCTTTPDQTMPNMASRIQNQYEIKAAGCIDVYAACAGFVYGLQLANGLIGSGAFKKILVAGAETLTKWTDFTDRTSCILFGDAAGVAIVEPSDEQHFLAFNAGTNGEFGSDLYLSNNNDLVNGNQIKTNNRIVQNGRTVFKWAVSNIPIKIQELLDKAGLSIDDVDYIIPHSANLRILEAIAKQLDVSMDKILESVTEFGNTSSASIPLALDKAIGEGKIKKGDVLLLIGFGGGLTFAGTIIKL